MSHRRPLARRKGLRRYRKLFVVSTEGSKTEPQYFDLLNSKSAAVHIHCLGRRRGQSPERVLAAMDKYMKEVRPKRKKRRDDRDDFEAWLVIDRDQWEMDEIDQLHSWARSHPNTHLAVSYPCFEYWLLLHFEDGDRVTGPQECIDRLKKHLPGYDKGVNSSDTSTDMIRAAVERAKRRHQSQGYPAIPNAFGSTVYKLVENILNSANEKGQIPSTDHPLH